MLVDVTASSAGHGTQARRRGNTDTRGRVTDLRMHEIAVGKARTASAAGRDAQTMATRAVLHFRGGDDLAAEPGHGQVPVGPKPVGPAS